MTVIRSTGANNGFGLLMDSTGSGNNNLGMAVGGSPKATFAWDNTRNFIGYANLVYSANDFAFRLNSDGSLTYHDGASSVERFRITKDGNVGIGATNPQSKMVVHTGGSGGEINLGTPSGESGMAIIGTDRADVRFDGLTLKLLAGTGPAAMASTNGINVTREGKVGIGTTAPVHRLRIGGGPPWT
jgi:hypothetical protein